MSDQFDDERLSVWSLLMSVIGRRWGAGTCTSSSVQLLEARGNERAQVGHVPVFRKGIFHPPGVVMRMACDHDVGCMSVIGPRNLLFHTGDY